MIKGRCLCGAVTFEIVGTFKEVSHCHCSMCRRSHGAAYATYAHVAVKDLKISGGEHVRYFQSSKQVARSFCGECGSRLFFRHAGMPKAIWVAAGVLDDHSDIRPQAHIFTGSKAPWHTIDDDLPQFEEYPPS